MQRLCSLFLFAVLASGLVSNARAGDLRISIPRRTKPTPVQQLNRDGVKYVQKHDYAKAKKLFYKAYLLDPNDPFTLNNLGYISELDGDIERAQRYYTLAGEMNSDAIVDRASNKVVEGKAVAQVAGNAQENSLQINRLNVQAMSLLMKDRAPEAELLLGEALRLDIHNPYTLNNIGYAREQEGEMDSALSYYSAAAATHSKEPVIVTVNRDWRGRTISEVAERNADKLRRTMEELSTDATSRVARLNLRGVSAVNRNDLSSARKDFQTAYKLDPNNAFTLNNMGYLAELDGDRETAQFYYAKAREADANSNKVGLSTRKEFQGQPLRDVADFGNQRVEAGMQAALMARRRLGGPVQLKRRDGSAIVEPAAPLYPPHLQVLPSSDQPMPSEPLATQPQPDNQQPATSNQPLQAEPTTKLLMPLPDNQQPPAAKDTTPPNTSNQQQPQNPSGGLLMPLPDDQQPKMDNPPQPAKPPKPPK